MNPYEHPLVGRWFLTFNKPEATSWDQETPPKMVERRGQILEAWPDGYFLCEFYSWILGLPALDDTTKKRVSITEMDDWAFFEDEEEMAEDYNLNWAPVADRWGRYQADKMLRESKRKPTRTPDPTPPRSLKQVREDRLKQNREQNP